MSWFCMYVVFLDFEVISTEIYTCGIAAMPILSNMMGTDSKNGKIWVGGKSLGHLASHATFTLNIVHDHSHTSVQLYQALGTYKQIQVNAQIN